MEYLLRPSVYTTAQKDQMKADHGLAPVAFIQRSCNPPSDRDSYIYELMRYIDVDSYGKCLNNKKLPDKLHGISEMLSEGFIKFFQRYKFILAFENARCDDYMTEKLFRTLNIGVIPIYMGSPNVKEWLPDPNLIIMVDDFESPAKLAEYIKRVDSDSSLYESFLSYKKTGNRNPKLKTVLSNRQWGLNQLSEMSAVTGFECHVCDQIHRNKNRIKIGELPHVYQATFEHYGCPKPTRNTFQNSPGTSDWQRNHWDWHYNSGKELATSLYKDVFNNSYHYSGGD